jgi:hypothetical protein
MASSQPGYYKFGLQYDSAAFGGLSRDLFAGAMRTEGIALDPGFRSLHLTHASRRFRAVGTLTHATDADARVLTLHHPVLLEGPTAMQQFVDAAERISRHADAINKLPSPPHGERGGSRGSVGWQPRKPPAPPLTPDSSPQRGEGN